MVFTWRWRSLVAVLAATIPVAFLSIFFLWPLGHIAWRALIGGGLAGSESTISARAVANAAITTVGLASAGTALTLAIGLPATWALHRRSWQGAFVLRAVLSAPFVLPTVVVAIAFLTLARDALPALASWHGVPAIVLSLAFFNVAVVLRIVGPSIEHVDERLVTAARSLGASDVAVTRKVIWPSVRSAVGGAAAVTFLFCATSFALVLVLGGTRVQTLETAAYIELTAFLDLRGAAAIALVQAALVACAAVVVSRLTRTGRAPAARTAPLRLPAQRRHTPWIILGLVPAIVLTITPLTMLALRSVQGDGGPTLSHYAQLWAGSPGNVALGRSLAVSVALATMASVIACTLGILATTAGALSRSLRWVPAATIGPLAVSSVVVGVGLLLALAVPSRSWGDLGTYALLTAAQTLVALPLVVRTLAPAVAAIDAHQMAAAATLGASPVSAVIRVAIPHLRGAFAGALGLAFAVAVGEFGASVFLARPGVPTLPTAIVRLLARPGPENLSMAAAGAVVLAIIAGAAMMVADITRRETRAP